MVVYCLNNPILYVDNTGSREIKCDISEGVGASIEGLSRIEATVGIVAASLVIVVLIADDVTCADVADDGALAPTAMIWWDCAMVLF